MSKSSTVRFFGRLQNLNLPWHFWATLLVLVLVIGARVVTTVGLPMPPCTFRMLTGHPCLSCGITRCFVALSNLDLAAAFHFNPLAAGIAVGIMARSLMWAGMKFLGKHQELRVSDRRTMVALRAAGVAALLGNWVYLIHNRI